MRILLIVVFLSPKVVEKKSLLLTVLCYSLILLILSVYYYFRDSLSLEEQELDRQLAVYFWCISIFFFFFLYLFVKPYALIPIRVKSLQNVFHFFFITVICFLVDWSFFPYPPVFVLIGKISAGYVYFLFMLLFCDEFVF